jgi:hypothetical protein
LLGAEEVLGYPGQVGRIAVLTPSASRSRSAVTISSWSRRYSSRRAAEALRRFRSPHIRPCLARALCGIAGTVFAMNNGSFGATSADLFLVVILAAVFLGGPGQAYGAMAGAVIIGLATEISPAYINPS